MKKKEELLSSMLMLFILLISASCLIYFAEHDEQPDKFSSIPESMWWGVVTLTTVGYGDVVPATVPGKIIGAGIAILGIAMFAIPTAILGAGFVEEMEKHREKMKEKRLEHEREKERGKMKTMVCPHCGKKIGKEVE